MATPNPSPSPSVVHVGHLDRNLLLEYLWQNAAHVDDVAGEGNEDRPGRTTILRQLFGGSVSINAFFDLEAAKREIERAEGYAGIVCRRAIEIHGLLDESQPDVDGCNYDARYGAGATMKVVKTVEIISQLKRSSNINALPIFTFGNGSPVLVLDDAVPNPL